MSVIYLDKITKYYLRLPELYVSKTSKSKKYNESFHSLTVWILPFNIDISH